VCCTFLTWRYGTQLAKSVNTTAAALRCSPETTCVHDGVTSDACDWPWISCRWTSLNVAERRRRWRGNIRSMSFTLGALFSKDIAHIRKIYIPKNIREIYNNNNTKVKYFHTFLYAIFFENKLQIPSIHFKKSRWCSDENFS